ncbi:acyl-CoA dehydrogenase family protein [Sphingomonas sp.]|uniref:acyl-CoA dehydrogenase family protein n=1 Tax=Sphingomonas sp. TaxID=28214 RepID=UPI002FC8C964
MSALREAEGGSGAHSASEVTGDDLIARARALVPVLRERAVEDARNSRIRKETIEDIRQAGLWKIFVPKRWGGFEMGPKVAVEVLMTLAKGDMSVAWVSAIYQHLAGHLPLFPEEAQAEVWADNPDARLVSPYAPMGRATAVPGGFRLTGRWGYSSGSPDSHWAIIGGLIIAEGNKPQYRLFLIPHGDYRIGDNWNVLGLEATSSHDLVIDDVFVPEHRTLHDHGLDDRYQPGLTRNTNWIWKIPHYQLGFRNLSTTQIGALEAMIEDFIALNTGRINSIGQKVKLDPDAQLMLAKAISGVDEMRAILMRTFTKLEDYARAGELPSVQERMLWRYQSGEVAYRCAELADGLFRASGGNSIRHEYRFEMIYRNILAARAHLGNNAPELGRRLGSFMMEGELSPFDTQL